jgi:hypothetical protein
VNFLLSIESAKGLAGIRTMKRSISCLLLSLAAFSLGASTQGASAQGASKENLELSGGYAHISGDLGLNGFDVGVAAWFTRRFAIAVDYDSGWNTSRIGIFELTQTGLVVAKEPSAGFPYRSTLLLSRCNQDREQARCSFVAVRRSTIRRLPFEVKPPNSNHQPIGF